MGSLQKYMIWYAQLYGGGLPPRLWLEVKRHLNFDKHSTKPKKKFYSAILGR